MGNLAQVHGQGRQDHAAMAPANRALDLRDRRFDRPDRYETLRDKAIAGARPFVNQPIVVRLDASDF